ncbi:MAG: hypothetical protein ACLQVY_19260 [Limisphaerales bacterium]
MNPTAIGLIRGVPPSSPREDRQPKGQAAVSKFGSQSIGVILGTSILTMTFCFDARADVAGKASENGIEHDRFDFEEVIFRVKATAGLA